jgi:hypothetical protein
LNGRGFQRLEEDSQNWKMTSGSERGLLGIRKRNSGKGRRFQGLKEDSLEDVCSRTWKMTSESERGLLR